MSAIQRRGSSNTYAKRYAFCNGFGIMTADEDTDGNGKGTASEKTELKEKKESEEDPKEINKKVAEYMEQIETDLGNMEFAGKRPAQAKKLQEKALVLKKEKNITALRAFAESVTRQCKAFAMK